MKNMELIELLKIRFLDSKISASCSWDDIEAKLKSDNKALAVLEKMEQSGGEPALVKVDQDGMLWMDASVESPSGRRSLCYDETALQSRKQNKPQSSVEAELKKIGCQLLNKEDYVLLQAFKKVDLKTSSWIETPENIRKLGGALFGDNRYDEVFFYHNGAESYYAARGFRGKLWIRFK